MHKFALYNQVGDNVGTLDASDKVFGLPKFRADLVHEAAVAQRANSRIAIAHTKTRGEVRGGGKKPWKQKGTGRARVGSIRSPLWRGGGVTFGPRSNRNFSKKISRKAKLLAQAHALSELAREGRIFVIDKLDLPEAKSKQLFQKLTDLRQKLSLGRKILLVVPAKDENVSRAGKNLQNLNVIEARNVSLIDLLSANSIVIIKDSLGVLEKAYGITR